MRSPFPMMELRLQLRCYYIYQVHCSDESMCLRHATVQVQHCENANYSGSKVVFSSVGRIDPRLLSKGSVKRLGRLDFNGIYYYIPIGCLLSCLLAATHRLKTS